MPPCLLGPVIVKIARLPLFNGEGLVFITDFNTILPDFCSMSLLEPLSTSSVPVTLSWAPPWSPRANQSCFHLLLGGFAFKSELLMVEKMPLSVLGSLQQDPPGMLLQAKVRLVEDPLGFLSGRPVILLLLGDLQYRRSKIRVLYFTQLTELR